MATETQIQKSISSHLDKNGWFILRLKVTNIGGIPDLLALKKDHPPFFIEVKKTSGGIVSKLQEYIIRKLISLGFDAIVANSLDVVKEYEKKKNW